MKNHASRLERRLAVEREERLEPGPDERPGTWAARPARDGLIEEGFDEALRREIGPVDSRGGRGEIEPDRCPAGEVGKLHQQTFPELRSWFQAKYEILLGQDQGPRMGSFIAIYGLAETISILDRVLAGEDLSK